MTRPQTQAMERRQSTTAPVRSGRAFGDLPPATTTISLARALELAGVDEPELALAAATTFKEARSLEELVTLVATTRRRKLDLMTRQVYYEKFGGVDDPPSLHIAIDGLRAIAANTGRYAGRLEPRFAGTLSIPSDDRGGTRTVPEKCVVTVYAVTAGGHKGAFEGVAWWEEAAYFPSGKLRPMFRNRPRGMLAIAAERQALRSAFPAETGGLADYDGPEDVVIEQAAPPRQATPALASRYEEIFDEQDVAVSGDRLVSRSTGEVLEEDKQAAAIVDRANDAVRQRQAEIAEIDRQRKEEGLL